MANNRLYLVDTETFEYIMLAKGFTDGWEACDDSGVAAFLKNRDLDAVTGDGKTRLALFTEVDLPKECLPHSRKKR